MNNISDITIMIAVVALALWPAIIVYISWKREKKIISSIKNEQPQVLQAKPSTEELVISTLKKMGCNPEKNEDGNIGFMYQGDDFYLSLQEDVPFVMIWYPWWGTINTDNPVLPYLKEIINAINISSFITTVFMAENEGDKEIGIHSHCHTFFTESALEPEEHLKLILDSFFDTRNAIKENIDKLGSAISEEDEDTKKERVIVKGFSAYKENSKPIEKKEK
ncbi:hypothetical protein [uncultured Bacteroides sp.]|uniref:hypothetical protein n=1 Tax=uncultured Bacteroides sp. TaxID=162156 RepID=UPI0025E73A35|nr:hypothetical protein [uncultured Bacteroides sp.]